jgi:hypothetical protein
MNPAGPPWPDGAARIDGRYGPIEPAKISVLDLGVTRWDGTQGSCTSGRGSSSGWRPILPVRRQPDPAAARPGYGRDQIEAILYGCVRHAGLRYARVLMTCTRGRLAAGSRDLRTARPTFYCYAVPFVSSGPEIH